MRHDAADVMPMGMLGGHIQRYYWWQQTANSSHYSKDSEGLSNRFESLPGALEATNPPEDQPQQPGLVDWCIISSIILR